MSSFGAVVRAVSLGRLRGQPGRLLVTVAAIALGVSLATAVFVINAGALNEFGLAARKLVGEADLIVRGPRQGFDESVFVRLAQEPGVDVVSPVLELEVVPLGGHPPLKVMAVDPFRAAPLQPELVAGVGRDLLALFEPGAVALSAEAARELAVRAGDVVSVRAGAGAYDLRVVAVMPADAYAQRLALMDIATAQWVFDRVGRVNRIDLRLDPGRDVGRLRERLSEVLPPGVNALSPGIERDRAAEVTRAYRVNLNMLALVALLTGAFLVFSTQALSILRRRSALALLRAVGATRRQVELALLAEGMLLGAAGSLVGVVLGQVVASLALARLGGDLGGGFFGGLAVVARPEPAVLAAFFAIGTAVAAIGAWLPAREAAATSPARALKSGDAEQAAARLRPVWPGAVVGLFGAACAWMPPVGGLPVFGYVSVAALLAAGVMLVPAAAARLLDAVPRPAAVTWKAALAQLRGSASQSAVSLAAIIVSFSLMVAMAIMVYSFRESFERWLGDVLPADLHVRVASSSDTAYWTPADQAAIAAVDGIQRIRFQRWQEAYLAPDQPPVAVIAREVSRDPTQALPLVRGADFDLPEGAVPTWVSEAVTDLYGVDVGDTLELPLAGRRFDLVVAGVWRDYGRSTGAVVVDRDWYVARTGDQTASHGAVWLVPGASTEEVAQRIRGRFDSGEDLQVLTGTAIRELSLRIFDRAFAVTYLLEAVAVVIGLIGVSFAFSSQALARRAEFGMLRHVGMLRRQVVAMLAGEGALMSALGVLYGLALGFVLSLVLVYVINRQSFNWSIEIAFPWDQLALLGAVLVAAASVTAMLSGRAATSEQAVRAVREDW